jgi:DNA-binding response OmpR family regulator
MSALDLGEEQFLTEGPRKSDPLGEALVLIVDSDPSSAEFMARALTQSEMQVVIADRIAGSDGASMQLRTQPSIGVVVIDPLAVPGRDNLTELREAGLAEDIQVIVVAEPVILGRYAQAARGEIADFLPKPVARRTLLRAVLEAQKRHHSLRNSRLREVDQAPGSNIERLIERASLVPSARRAPIRDPSSELGLLQLLDDIDECRSGALVGILEPDACWSMLSELMRARLSRRRVSVTSLCLASKSPVTTALRRIERLLEAGLVSCTQDPKDRRRKYIELTDNGNTRLVAALRAVSDRVRGE